MSKHLKIPSMIIVLLVLCMTLSMSALAVEAPVFQDVSTDSPWYDSILYAVENGITSGTGNGHFSPDQNITARQWAVMICRAYNKEVKAAPDAPFGAAEMKLGFDEGWLDLSAMVSPDSVMCRRYTYESIFRVERIPVFSSNLYAAEEQPYENSYIRVAKKNGLCEDTADALDLITRGEAIHIIHTMLTKEIRVDTPSLVQMVNLVNADNTLALNDFLVEINKIPEAILYEFQADGWSYRIDSKFVDDFGNRKGENYAGCCSYMDKSIYVKYYYATIHEFGHYYHHIIDATGFDDIYKNEAEVARRVLGDYATTNESEYFAESFEYWINWSDNSKKMNAFAEVAPETYEFFRNLALSNWERVA